MKLRDGKSYFNQILEKEVDEFIELHSMEYVTPSPLVTVEEQIATLRSQMLSILKREKYFDDFKEAVEIIKNQLPRIISFEEYEAVEKEFIQVIEVLEGKLDSIVDMDKETIKNITVGELYGFTENTHKQIDKLINELYNNEYYEDARKVSLFLFFIASRCIEGGLALGRCLDRLGRYQEATKTYQAVQKIFPDDPISRILCAKVCLADGDLFKAGMYLEEGVKMLEQDQAMMKEWLPLIKKIQSQL